MDRNKIVLQISNFLTEAQSMIDNYMGHNFPNLDRSVLNLELGKKYAKVYKTDMSGRSIFCFIDLTNGDILKAATWKQPAKHARGNIFHDNPTSAITPYGAKYLK